MYTIIATKCSKVTSLFNTWCVTLMMCLQYTNYNILGIKLKRRIWLLRSQITWQFTSHNILKLTYIVHIRTILVIIVLLSVAGDKLKIFTVLKSWLFTKTVFNVVGKSGKLNAIMWKGLKFGKVSLTLSNSTVDMASSWQVNWNFFVFKIYQLSTKGSTKQFALQQIAFRWSLRFEDKKTKKIYF